MAVREVRSCDYEISKKKGSSDVQIVPCGKDAEILTFGLDAETFEIDLCDGHRDSFTTVLVPFRDVARQTGKPTGKKKIKAASVDNAAVRKWLGTQGIEVSPKGRIPNKHIEAYLAAKGA